MEGKTIQLFVRDRWEDHNSPGFDHRCQYRVKPESREWWVNIYDSFETILPTKTEADMRNGILGLPRRECVHVREVID